MYFYLDVVVVVVVVSSSCSSLRRRGGPDNSAVIVVNERIEEKDAMVAQRHKGAAGGSALSQQSLHLLQQYVGADIVNNRPTSDIRPVVPNGQEHQRGVAFGNRPPLHRSIHGQVGGCVQPVRLFGITTLARNPALELVE
jgi:hypothetical protein